MVKEFGEAAAEKALVGAAVKQRRFKSGGGQAVALGLGNALDQAVEAEASQIITHSARGDFGWLDAEQLRK